MSPNLSFPWKSARGARWRWSFALLASSLAVGCGQPAPEGAEASLSPAAVDPVAALESPLASNPNTNEDLVADRPVVESLVAIPQTEATKNSATVFELKLDAKREQNQQFKGKTLSMLDGTQELLFRDDGLEGDAVAGDLVFAAKGVFDFDALKLEQRRISDTQAKQQEPLTQPVFEGRELVRTVPVAALSTDVFKAGTRIPIRPVGLSTLVDPARSLLVRAPAVVNDLSRTWDPCTGAGNPNGKWTFNYLMTEMANQPFTGVAPSTFVREWLRQWETPQTVNGFGTPARGTIVTKLINPWPKVTGSTTTLDLARSPMKLIAIVNRLDLAGGNPVYGGSGRAGEGRFIFAATEGSGSSCHTVPFLVILEYGVNKNDCNAVKVYAQQWQALSGLTLGSAAYNTALEALTEQFAKRDLAPSKPNRSAINQVRTNENWLITIPWELREFHLWDPLRSAAGFAAPGPVANMLNGHTVAQTPDRATKNTLFAPYVNANAPSIVALPPTYTVPLQWTSSAFLGGRAIVPSPTGPAFWNQPAGTLPNRQARHVFSLNTCDGCHGDELNTPFTHVSQTGALSPFLSGALVRADKADGTPTRTFNEMLGRQTFLDQAANQSCLTLAFAASNAVRVH